MANELETKVAELEQELAAAKAAYAELEEARIKDLADMEELQAKYEALSIEKTSADATISNLLAQVKMAADGNPASSVSVNAEAKAPVIPEPVELDGQKVKFLKPTFHLDGVDYTAEQAAGNTDIVKALLAIDGQQIVAVEA